MTRKEFINFCDKHENLEKDNYGHFKTYVASSIFDSKAVLHRIVARTLVWRFEVRLSNGNWKRVLSGRYYNWLNDNLSANAEHEAQLMKLYSRLRRAYHTNYKEKRNA